MRGTVTEAFVDEVRGVYMAQGIEVEVPEDRIAELSRWMRFEAQKAKADEAPKKTAPKKKAVKKR